MRHAAGSTHADPARAALPPLTPMLATPGALPAAAEDAQWGYETKWDGARLLAFVDGDGVRLRSRNDLDVTVSYPELAGLAGALGDSSAVLDGEVVAFGPDGLPSFARLQRRMHVGQAREALRLSGTDPVRFLVFDVLHLDGRPTVGLPYTERRALLAGLDLDGAAWQCPPHFVGNGALVLRASQELGLEGVVAKRLASSYRPGRRSPDWRKIKNIRMQEVVVVGWQPGNGRRAGTIGSLLVGVPDAPSGALRYAGKVGTGFTEAALAGLLRRLQPLARRTPAMTGPPPRAEAPGAHWVEPVLVGEVAFGEWTPEGRLRHPVWRGLRPDKAVAEVHIEG